MKIESIPFNELLGIKRAQAPFILLLEESERLKNHLGTVHASAQLALAEATSGQILISHFGDATDDTLPVVRRVDAKFKAPMRGRIVSRSTVTDQTLHSFSETLSEKGRALVSIPVEVLDDSEAIGLLATIEWFAQRHATKANPRESE